MSPAKHLEYLYGSRAEFYTFNREAAQRARNDQTLFACNPGNSSFRYVVFGDPAHAIAS